MSFEAVVLQVLIASPTDVSQDRDHAEAAIHAWNRDRTVGRKVVLLPLRWETGSVPELHAEGPQAVINEQLVGGTDIVIALFHGRFGAGGAGEEIEKAPALGAQVHVWFSEAPIPHDADMDELQKVRDFQAILKGRGLLGTYASADVFAPRCARRWSMTLINLQKRQVASWRKAELRRIHEQCYVWTTATALSMT